MNVWRDDLVDAFVDQFRQVEKVAWLDPEGTSSSSSSSQSAGEDALSQRCGLTFAIRLDDALELPHQSFLDLRYQQC